MINRIVRYALTSFAQTAETRKNLQIKIFSLARERIIHSRRLYTIEKWPILNRLPFRLRRSNSFNQKDEFYSRLFLKRSTALMYGLRGREGRGIICTYKVSNRTRTFMKFKVDSICKIG